MASSDNFATMDPWVGRLTAFPDSWISETYARDTEALTMALQMSLSKTNAFCPIDPPNSFVDPVLTTVTNCPDVASSTPSNLSGSEPDTPFARRQRATGVVAGKVSKRKSRASKRSQTTFIAADPANFRQMVQEVTGVKISGSRATVNAVPLFKPEPQKAGVSSLLQSSVSCLPTLDTSALLLDRYQNVGNALPAAPEIVPEPVMVGADAGSSSFDFDAFSCFPTLESWKVIS